MEQKNKQLAKVILSLLLPFAACAIQWLLWPLISPFVWFLFFPTVFFSSRIGGKISGLVSTAISVAMVVYFFMPPQLSLIDKPGNTPYSVIVFLIMGVLFSLTHDKLEKANRRASEALEETRLANNLLLESNKQVTLLYEKTIRLDELKSRFFANVSHELRTPLSLILGPVGRCLTDSTLSDEQKRNLEVVERNARLLYRQVSDLLDVAKLEAGEMQLCYSNVDLSNLVRFVASHFENIAEEKSIAFSIDTPDSVFAQIDQEKCRRILLNLLSNAFKFTATHGAISVKLLGGQMSATIIVQDNGPGIPENCREMIFERFSQIDGGTERKHGGTGLGLAIVKEFVRLHNGNVNVCESPGGGAMFTVTLPVTAPDNTVIHPAGNENGEHVEHLAQDTELNAATKANMPVSPDAPLILVIEDNPDMNSYITSLMGRFYRVISAHDGEEGLASIHSNRPDLLISDMMMPKMSGERLVQELRNHPEMDSMPIIILSAKADDELRVRLLENGVQDYLTKPFSDEELLAKVKGMLAEKRRTTEELKKSEALLKQAQQIAKVGSWFWDNVSDTHVWSDETYRIYGRNLSLPPAKYPEVSKYFTPESWVNLSAAVETGLQFGTSYECDAEIIRDDGSHCWITACGIAEKDTDGNIIRMHGTIQDISERRLAAEKIRQLNINLEQRVEERTAELLSANQELDAFAYAVSHDLRAPLRAMNGFSQALLEDFGKQLQGDASKYLEQIIIASKQMGGLIDGLLTLSRSTRGELNCDMVNLTQLAERFRDDIIRCEPERNATWEIESGLMAYGDRRMLEAVIQNLIGNAWKYSAKKERALIRVYSEARNGTSYYCISDNGAGFDMRHKDKLFKPFQRLHRQDEFPGIGIGLATVQRVIHRHGGEIFAESEPGNGAVFSFSLSAESKYK